MIQKLRYDCLFLQLFVSNFLIETFLNPTKQYLAMKGDKSNIKGSCLNGLFAVKLSLGDGNSGLDFYVESGGKNYRKDRSSTLLSHGLSSSMMRTCSSIFGEL